MIGNKWDIILSDEFKKDYFVNLMDFVSRSYSEGICYPSYDNIFNAFKLTDYDDVRVVILGQDPYHGEGEAHGLAFSVLEGVKRPPSLNNIFKELDSDLGIIRESNDLTSWALSGVLLLNCVLTVAKDNALSHKKQGWEVFTDNVIRSLNDHEKPIIYVLWGNLAKSKKKLINLDKHFVIESVHPSPLSCYNGFYGSKPFSQINSMLDEKIDFS